jgi:diguanylate cyclase (GGDEF)-like protein
MSLLPPTGHTTLIAGVIVQSTSALILALLAATDRRSRGTVWLAVAGGLDAAAIALCGMNAVSENIAWEAVVAAILLLSALCAYLGLHWFAHRKPASPHWPVIALSAVAATLAFDPLAPHVTLMLARLASLAMVITIVKMLWVSPVVALRPILRATACFLGLIVALRFVTLTLDLVVLNVSRTDMYGNELLLAALIVTDFLFVAIFVADSNCRLHEETRTDVLTGVRNRRAFEETAQREVSRAASNGQIQLALLMLDLDRFKALNDAWGHALGDRALRAVSEALLTSTGTSGTVARLGGEEFVVLLPGMEMKQAGRTAERLREAVELLRLESGQALIPMTVSVGVSALHPGETDWAGMMRRADVALYRAKHHGRNRVALCDEDPELPATVPSAEPMRTWRRMVGDRGPLL